ncbi:zinc ribbon domain-containing protein [Lentilactobacillus diolivorans]|uniref:Zinc-ribbon domain-containing protein n=2 Tax=Lentilactobacillus diolivorans TaxID=179838 RepID=A0A0R1SFD6_9LACO|nr:zinc-ribbon domain-containing protein [Lentilactobacillus diolivorans]KRL67983.1 hypothetical protein FC85_GL002500 [Lentilactobacillus diolivorans DSM 14421]GEP25332.1 membrane protein [Lentilactobacillus diolivorans]
MKVCPNCQKENLADAKFCVYCGFNLINVSAASSDSNTPQSPAPDSQTAKANSTAADPQANPNQSAAFSTNQDNNQQQTNSTGSQATADATQTNTRYAATNHLFNSFLRYIKESLINPNNNIEAPHYGGLMSIGLYVVIMLIMFGVFSRRIVGAIENSAGNDLSSQVVSSVTEPIASNIMAISGILIISLAAYLIIAYAVRRLMLNDNIAFLDFTDLFGIYLNISSVLLLATFVLSLFVSVAASAFLLFLILALFGLSQVVINYGVVMVLKDVQGKFNTFYSMLVAEILPAIVIYLISMQYLNDMVTNLANTLQNTFSGY